MKKKNVREEEEKEKELGKRSGRGLRRFVNHYPSYQRYLPNKRALALESQAESENPSLKCALWVKTES